jgi:hypothetical protein
MSTTVIISIIVSSICLILALWREIRKIVETNSSDKITLVKGDKKITISKMPTQEDRRKLAHF